MDVILFAALKRYINKRVGDSSGKQGVTFTPSVSEEGILSWTNDGNLENPKPVNIKGRNGIYIGSGEMPPEDNLQIDFSGEATDLEFLPPVTEADNGQVATVIKGTWQKGPPMSGIYIGSDTPPKNTTIQVDPATVITQTIPEIKNEFGTSIEDGISQDFFTKKIQEIESKIKTIVV